MIYAAWPGEEISQSAFAEKFDVPPQNCWITTEKLGAFFDMPVKSKEGAAERSWPEAFGIATTKTCAITKKGPNSLAT